MTTSTKRLTTAELRQIIDSHEKGHAMIVPINCDYLAAKELLAVREAQPVVWASVASIDRGDVREVWPNGEQDKAGNLSIAPLFTAPPAPAVPDAVDYSDLDATSQDREVIEAIAECRGWNAYRAEMLNHFGGSNEKAEPVSQGYTLPDEMTADQMYNLLLEKGGVMSPVDAAVFAWNACRAKVLAAAPTPTKAVNHGND